MSNRKDFTSLLRDSQNILGDIDEGPNLQRNLAQLDAASRRLARSQSKPQEVLITSQSFVFFFLSSRSSLSSSLIHILCSSFLF
jgi:hypothetical protein